MKNTYKQMQFYISFWHFEFLSAANNKSQCVQQVARIVPHIGDNPMFFIYTTDAYWLRFTYRSHN